MKSITMRAGMWGLAAMFAGGVLLWQWQPARKANARPSAPGTFCGLYADSPLCASGQVECKTCHTATPPGVNPFGQQVKDAMGADGKPLSHEAFTSGLQQALKKIEGMDADKDGVTNLVEIQKGYAPGDASVKPTESVACEPGQPGCGYDYIRAYKKVSQDFCGQMVSFEDLEKFREVQDKKGAISALLDKCFDTPYWNGKNGVIWQMSHRKIRPGKYGKAGEDAGLFPVADYYLDYNLITYAHTDNRDARLLLTAQYYVGRKEENGKSVYYKMDKDPDTNYFGNPIYSIVPKEKRAGVMTTPWTLGLITMFSVIPRATAAQMYRSYLGKDIAKREGLYPVRNEPADYDNKNVRAEGCKGCHQTLDAMAYPFTRYNGVSVQAGKLLTYIPDRMKFFERDEGPRIKLVPESGVLLGKRVKDLMEWAQVAANSDEFAQATVLDYWKLLMGAEPSFPKERQAFEKLWKDFKSVHQYGVERMLHALVQSEVYGAP
ncbi:MAG: hypothetical protein EP343_31450 [Deltaproteobacteria bacterium]|nr:MAG: hypothetical protein EP343_31450 [Deltaproteobacteria bacterium]